MPTVFLSYHRADTQTAERLASFLKTLGANPFIDTKDIALGESWQHKIIDRLNAADLVIVLWSHQSVRSNWVNAEASRAADSAKYFPILIDDVELPLPFRQYHSLRVSGDDWGPVEKQLKERLKLKEDQPPSVVDQDAIDFDQDSFVYTPAPEQIGRPVQQIQNRAYSSQGRASRVRVFIAHASNDKPRLRDPITVLLKAGFRVWIDKPFELSLDRSLEKLIGGDRIHYGDDWRERIKRAIDRSHVVLACWSLDAIRGRREQFYYEIFCGLVQQKLVQCRIDKVPIDEIGMPYTFSHIADLSEFDLQRYSPQLETLMQDMSDRRKSFFGLFRH